VRTFVIIIVLSMMFVFAVGMRLVKPIFFCIFPPGLREYVFEFGFWVDSASDHGRGLTIYQYSLKRTNIDP